MNIHKENIEIIVAEHELCLPKLLNCYLIFGSKFTLG